MPGILCQESIFPDFQRLTDLFSPKRGIHPAFNEGNDPHRNGTNLVMARSEVMAIVRNHPDHIPLFQPFGKVFQRPRKNPWVKPQKGLLLAGFQPDGFIAAGHCKMV